jgi:hypothetical protein
MAADDPHSRVDAHGSARMKQTLVGFALLTLASASAGASPGVQVRKAWGPAGPPTGVVVDAAPRQDGSVLAASGSAVFSFDVAGRVRSVAEGGAAVLDPSGQTCGIQRDDAFLIFDASGQPLGSLPALPHSLFKLALGGRAVYAPRIVLRREFGVVEDARLLRPDGTRLADFAARGLEISRLLEDRLVSTLPDSLQAHALDGTELWSVRLQVHKFESAGERTILVRRYVPGEVLHFDRGQRLSEAKVEGVVWNLAISPDSHVSAATTRTALSVFRDGKLTARVRLPVAYANSVAVSDRGEVLVGGQDAKGAASILLYDLQGDLLWSGSGGQDSAAYRPSVRFFPGGDRFLVIERQGLTAYDVSRSQP